MTKKMWTVFTILYFGTIVHSVAAPCKKDTDCMTGMTCCESRFVKEVIAKNPKGDFGNYCAHECIDEGKTKDKQGSRSREPSDCELAKQQSDFYGKRLIANSNEISHANRDKLLDTKKSIDEAVTKNDQSRCLLSNNKLVQQYNALPHQEKFKFVPRSQCDAAMEELVVYRGLQGVKYPNILDFPDSAFVSAVKDLKAAYQSKDEIKCRASSLTLANQYIKITKDKNFCEQMCSASQCKAEIWGSCHAGIAGCPNAVLLLKCEACREIAPKLVQTCWNIYQQGEHYQPEL